MSDVMRNFMSHYFIPGVMPAAEKNLRKQMMNGKMKLKIHPGRMLPKDKVLDEPTRKFLTDQNYSIEEHMKDTTPNGGAYYLRRCDPVDHPEHYTSGSIECIAALEASLTPEEFRGFLKGNIIKYTWREKHKGGTESMRKAKWYLEKLITTDSTATLKKIINDVRKNEEIDDVFVKKTINNRYKEFSDYSPLPGGEENGANGLGSTRSVLPVRRAKFKPRKGRWNSSKRKLKKRTSKNISTKELKNSQESSTGNSPTDTSHTFQTTLSHTKDIPTGLSLRNQVKYQRQDKLKQGKK